MQAECVVLWGFLGLLNVVTLVVVRHDKHVAEARRSRPAGSRVPERFLWALGALGGGAGGIAGFAWFRHKTRKPWFLLVFVVASGVGYAAWFGWLSLLDCVVVG